MGANEHTTLYTLLKLTTRALYAGNYLTDACVDELVLLLRTEPLLASLTALDLSSNTRLTWRCAAHMATLLARPATIGRDRMPAAGGALPALRRLCLQGLALGRQGASLLAKALAHNTLLEVGSLVCMGVQWLAGIALCP